LKTRDAYVAIADPTRRRILDLLRDRGPLIASDVAARFARASRPGISRHLRVLRECGVLTARRDGKLRIYALRTKPLRDLHAGWLARFADMHTDSLVALRKRVEGAKS
jgi:DNA-binding transcriptional ArsR family regulator